MRTLGGVLMVGVVEQQLGLGIGGSTSQSTRLSIHTYPHT